MFQYIFVLELEFLLGFREGKHFHLRQIWT